MSGDGRRVSTGVEGLDRVLDGGLIPGRTYMVRGSPGSGKTLLGLHFLTAGVAAGETAQFISLEESADQLRQDAAPLGIDLDGVEMLDLSPDSSYFAEERDYDIFAPDEVERDPLSEDIAAEIDAVDPDRVVVDPVTQLRYLSPDAYQFHRRVLSFIEFLKDRHSTVVFTSQASTTEPDDDLQFLSDGVVSLGHDEGRRTVAVTKFRGSGTAPGEHSFDIDADGVVVYPELVPSDHDSPFPAETISSGVPEIDELMEGGLERGTVTIISGPTGAGKTTLGSQFAKEVAGRGERSVIYLFEENEATFLARSEAINVPVKEMVERGTLELVPIEPLTLSAQAFAQHVREQVETRETDIVMIDGVDGYRLSLHGDDDDTVRKLHALGRYLKNVGVTVILVDEVGTVTGDFNATSERLSYLADNIVFIRYLEFEGELRKAIGVLKMRTSDFERTLRDFQITSHGIKVGEPLRGLRGVLGGDPDLVDEAVHGDKDAGDGTAGD